MNLDISILLKQINRLSKELKVNLIIPHVSKYSLSYVKNLRGIEFEHYTANLLNRIGIYAVPTGGSEDFGADVLGSIKLSRKQRIPIGVQCKLYRKNEPVGYRAVEEITSAISYYHLDKGIVLTNSHFTWNALKGAKRNHVLMWDGKDLRILMMLAKNRIHISNLNKMFHLLKNIEK